MTRLLVSVRDADEALAALAGGADLIDIKEPAHGALGAAHQQTWHEVIHAIAGRAPLSAALGELLDVPTDREFSGLALVKAGLAGCATHKAWKARLQQFHTSLPATTGLVAVIYADAACAAAPAPLEVLDMAIQMQLGTVLIDTFNKARGDLWTALGEGELTQLVERARHHGIKVALAGSIGLKTIHRALELAPDWIAVRGAACEGGRTGRISTARVSALKAIISPPKPLKVSSSVEIGTRL